jgi:hypothetical protein
VDCFLLLLGFGVGKYRNGVAAITAVVVVVVVAAAAVASSNGGSYVFLMCFFTCCTFKWKSVINKDASTVCRTRKCFFSGGVLLFLSSPACSCFLRYAVVAFDLLYLLLSFMLS